MNRKISPYIFISPFYIMFLAFMVVPIIRSFHLSFHKFVNVRVPLEFLGFSNYTKLLTDRLFWISLKNTLIYSASYVALIVVGATIIALMLNYKKLKLRRFFGTVYFIPVVTSLAVAAMGFSMVLDKDVGMLNLLLAKLNFPTYGWLIEPRTALGSLVSIALWKDLGFFAAMLLAGLQGIPEELYDAAEVDGASRLQVTLHIILPLLRPITAFVAIMAAIYALQVFELPFILTKGGPGTHTLSAVQYLYMSSFRFFKFGYASAMGTILFIIIFLISIFQLRYYVERQDQSI